ncbi:MAG TPA: hypothetical protein DEB74_12465 [Lachnospiraceae bacterium]|nr:hypothetical protein [Lachnospiraceae bacterium]
MIDKYFPCEDWEKRYNLKTGIMKRISRYAGLNFKEVLQLPYSYFLLLNKESWIDSYQGSTEGRKILKDLWRLSQTQADTKAVRAYQGRKENV